MSTIKKFGYRWYEMSEQDCFKAMEIWCKAKDQEDFENQMEDQKIDFFYGN